MNHVILLAPLLIIVGVPSNIFAVRCNVKITSLYITGSIIMQHHRNILLQIFGYLHSMFIVASDMTSRHTLGNLGIIDVQLWGNVKSRLFKIRRIKIVIVDLLN